MISCFTVTQEGRLPLLRLAVGDFCRQTLRDAELVVVHDGAATFHESVLALADSYAGNAIRVIQVPAGSTLGELRNAAVAACKGDHVCQWDDDDRYHPRRLEVQLDALRENGTDFCFLSDQLHLFADAREVYWDDWHDEPYPINFVQGTLLGRRDRMPGYRPVRRGEDTGLVIDLLRQGGTIARLRGQGYLYVYVFTGHNTFDQAHHASISMWRRFRGAQLIRLEAVLRRHVAEYDPPLDAFSMPYDGGRLEFP